MVQTEQLLVKIENRKKYEITCLMQLNEDSKEEKVSGAILDKLKEGGGAVHIYYNN